MKLQLDQSKAYGLVLEGGGAKGSYQIGAWKALREEGIQIRGVAGASVGALNGAFICMDDLNHAEAIWENLRYSDILNADEDVLEHIMRMDLKNISLKLVLEDLKRFFRDRGFDITPLRNLIGSTVNEEKIRNSPIDLYAVTYSFDDHKLLTVDVKETKEGQMGDMLLASAYFPAFKNEKLGGRRYLDGGSLNNVPINVLLERDYKDIIVIRIYGVGFDSEKITKIPEDVNVYRIAPRQDLGGVLEFDGKKARKNMLLGYYDAKRLLYGLEGRWYYIDLWETEEECLERLLAASRVWYSLVMEEEEGGEEKSLRWYMEQLFPRLASKLELKGEWNYRTLYVAFLEWLARRFKVNRFQIYTAEELKEQIAVQMEHTESDAKE